MVLKKSFIRLEHLLKGFSEAVAGVENESKKPEC